MFDKIVVRVIILVCCSHVLKAESMPSLPPDPMNAALLYYQAFQKHPKPDEVIGFLVYDTGLEELDRLFRTGECGDYEELKEEVLGMCFVSGCGPAQYSAMASVYVELLPLSPNASVDYTCSEYAC